MPKKIDPATALAEQMVAVLQAAQARGAEDYPPTLRRLAELCGGAPEPELILKAVAKKVFTEAGVVTEKVNRKPSLDSPVYVKGDAPAKPKRAPARNKPDNSALAEDLAKRMLLVLEAQRRLGEAAYPPTLRRLAELCDHKASDTLVPKAVSHDAMVQRAVVVGKPVLDAPVVLREDIKQRMASVLPALLRFALRPAPATAKGKKGETHAFTPSEVGKKFDKDLHDSVSNAVRSAVERDDLPQGIAWVEIKCEPYLFLLENLRPKGVRPAPPAVAHPFAPAGSGQPSPAPARPARDFAEAFREAFERLDRRNGTTNFVKLSDLRRELAGFRRDVFDAGLDKLRLDWQFSLSSHEGLNGSLGPEDREAGVREAGSLLVYASRR